MSKTLYRGLFACLSLAALASCQDYDGGFSIDKIKKAEYAKHFEQTFGTPDPNQDWTMAQQITAAINVPQVKGNATVYVFDGIPNAPTVHLLSETAMNEGKAAFRFDALKGIKSVYVAVMQEGKSVFSGTFSVDKSTLAIGEVKDMLAGMEMSQALTRSFSSSCPTAIKDVKEDLFTNIASDVSKYKFNGNFYTLAELRAWAQAECEAGRVTVDNYSTTTPFTNCVAGGSYDFDGATLASSVISVPAEGGYIFNGTYYTLTELRNYAQGLATAGTINTNNYGSVPFNSDCVIPQGADWSNPQIDPTKVNAIVDKDGYWCNLNNTWGVYTLEEIVEEKKKVTTNIGYSLSPLLWSSMVPAGTNQYEVTAAMIDWSKAQVDLTQSGVYEVEPDDIIWWPTGNQTYQKNTEAQIIAIVKARGTSDYTPLLESSIVKPAHLDFTNATVKESDANISLVAPGNSFIYNNTVYADESALQSYTIAQNLGNSGPYLNCFSGSGLDFSSATVDESKAPLTPVTFDIDLTYLSNVETEAATPWTRGWGYSLYGPQGFFMEQCNYYGDPSVGNMAPTFNKYTSLYGSSDSERRELLDKIEAGFKITSKGGVIELPFVYGATQIVDQFGYVFYKDGEDPLQQPHYILMEDGRPDVNLYLNSWQNGTASGWTGTSMSTWISSLGDNANSPIALKDNPINCYCQHGNGKWSEPYGTHEETHDEWCGITLGTSTTCTRPEACNKQGSGVYSSALEHLSTCNDPMKNYLSAYNEKCYGTKYRLVYFDEHGSGTYNIPAGLNIAFFICPVSSVAGLTSREGYNVGDFHYSLPELNKRIKHYYYNETSPSYVDGNHTEGSPNLRGAVKACAWKQDGMTFLGFEDGGRDEDLNDIVFWVEGEFETNDIVELYPVKWHMNLNGVHDENDGDLFAYTTLKTGDAYSQPSSNPKRDGYVFKGWAKDDAQGTPISGSTNPSTIRGTMGTEGICYFAIWEPVAVMPDTYTVKWHLNYSMTGHLTDDSDLFASTPGLLDGAAYDSPASNPSVPGKVFRGWSTTYNNAGNDATLNPIHGTIQGADVCYFAIWEDPVINHQSWIFACEDLGGTFDYDFNDVVWEVKIGDVSGSNAYIYVTVLAAGGTLPFTLQYNGTSICTKETAFNGRTDPQEVVNAGGNTTKLLSQRIVTVETGWTLTDNFSKFKVVVENNGDSHFIEAPDEPSTKAPQILIVPGEWEWPTETTHITKAYKDFTNWVKDATWSTWCSHKEDGMTYKVTH